MGSGPGDFLKKTRLGHIARSRVETGPNGPSNPQGVAARALARTALFTGLRPAFQDRPVPPRSPTLSLGRIRCAENGGLLFGPHATGNHLTNARPKN